VHLHAQRSAEGFYRRAGFTVLGEPWEEAGIAHIAMVQKL
jgi:predicted GNAT family N-acyltransferase